ncbi:SRPBCC family protein [Streptomyces sp. NPDC005576]|uniref:SRPBCC family protein n=1 Tax=Streptomyces sp. NPDC005576 TaxID=3364726 RepID=UPI0036C20241
MRAAIAIPLAVVATALLVGAGLDDDHQHSPSHGSPKAKSKAASSQSLTCDGVHVDEAAPVITRESTVIHAPLKTVWNVQTDVAKWPDWQPDVTSLVKSTSGPLRAGSVFRWKTQGLDITSTVKHVEHEKCLVWGGPAQGIDAVHVWTFEEHDGGVTVRTEESWSGAPVEAQPVALRQALEQSLTGWLNALKAEAEFGKR